MSTFDEKQAVIDHIVNTRYEEAILKTAAEYNVSTDRIRFIIEAGTSEAENHPAYNRYYEILQGFIDEAERA